MQSFKKTGIKLYEKLQTQGTHCLNIWGQKLTVHKVEKIQKLMQGLYQIQTMNKTCAKFKRNGIKLYELCSRGTHCLYIEGEK